MFPIASDSRMGSYILKKKRKEKKSGAFCCVQMEYENPKLKPVNSRVTFIESTLVKSMYHY